MNSKTKNSNARKQPTSADKGSQLVTGSGGRSTLVPLVVLLLAVLLSFVYYQRTNNTLSSHEQIITPASSEAVKIESASTPTDEPVTTNKADKNVGTRAPSPQHTKDPNNEAAESTAAKEEKSETAEVPDHQLASPKEPDAAQLDDEYSQKCKLGRGGIPKVPSHEGKIDVIQGRPEVDFFYDNYVRPGKPVVIKNAMKNWKALDSWTDAYLKEKIGDKLMKVERSYNKEFGYLADEKTKWSFSNMTFTNFTSVYLIPKPEDKNAIWEHYYLDSEFPEELKADVNLPDWIPCLHDEPPPFFRYTNMWMGGGEEISLLHNDWEDNLLHVVSGYKLFTLIDPKTPSEYLYEVYDDKVTETKLSPVNPTDPDVLTKYPLFAHAEPIQVLLEPGDILFIPALYWHQVNSYCRHISVNIWWDTHRLRDITEYVYFHKTADCVKRLHRRLPVCKWKRRKDNKS